jgi:SMC interacting uncharacterized protein involved in chromosome segregation
MVLHRPIEVMEECTDDLRMRVSLQEGEPLNRQSVAKVRKDKEADIGISVRRSSVYPGRQSMAPGTSLQPVVKDTRPIRDKTFMTNCQHNIADFLAMFRSNINVNQKTLTSPTGKEFQEMFKFFINFLVDGFTWGKSFEQDAFQLLRDLRYPSPENCGKTAISAPGTPQHWPYIIAMLNWLVDLCKVSPRAVSYGYIVEYCRLICGVGTRELDVARCCRGSTPHASFRNADRSSLYRGTNVLGTRLKGLYRVV